MNEDEYKKLNADVNTERFSLSCGRPEELSASEGHTSDWNQTHGSVISHLNVRSLFPRLTRLEFMLGNQADSNIVLGLSETCLDGIVNNGELQVPVYRMYRKDRSSGKGGGVMVYVSEGVKSRRRQNLENDFRWKFCGLRLKQSWGRCWWVIQASQCANILDELLGSQS